MTTPDDPRVLEATPDLAPGRVLRNKYRIERVLGRGGMGQVLEAFHIDLERRVAIKVLLPELRVHDELVERFLREGKAASRIEGEHVARILDVDRLEDGTPFLVMEYLEGTDLSAVRRGRTSLPIRDAVDYVVQACSAISRAHARGIIHRDIKPANLFLARTEDGSMKIKVLDFGISKLSSAIGSSEPGMTHASLVLGSAEYMSPEQMLSARDVDARTDIWALGVVLFELLTAAVPFPGESLTQVCALVMTQPPPRPRSLRPEIPELLEQVILQCLEKERDHRFPTADALSSALTSTLAITTLGLAPAPNAPVFGSPPAQAPPAAFSDVGGTSVLPVTPVPIPRAPEGEAAGTSSIAAAAPIESSAATSVSASHDPLSWPAGRPPSLTGSSHTTAAVASEPAPSPPENSALAVWIGGVVAVTALAVGIGVSVSIDRGPSASSAKAVAPAPVEGSVTTTTSGASRAAAPSASASASASAGIVIDVASAPPTPPIASSATTSPAIASSRRKPPPAAAPPIAPPTTPQRPVPPAKPVRTSGID